MSILGKLLIFFNLLAAGGVVYLATQNWQGRQTIAAAGVRHVLVLHGLPLGADPGDPAQMPADAEAEIPFRVPLAGGFQTRTVSKALLETYFKSAPGTSSDPNRDDAIPALGGPAVPTQLAEVRRVKAMIDAALTANAENAETKLKLLANWLQYQPETYEARQAVLAMIAEENVAGLEEELKKRFDAVLESPKAPEADAKTLPESDESKQLEKINAVDSSRLKPIDDTERRARVAHLLMHLDRDADWQKRVALVVGLRRHTATIVAQARRFLDMAERVGLSIPVDQTGFQTQSRALIRLAIDRTDLANRQADLKAKWVEQEAKEANFVGIRETQLKALQDRFTKVKADVDEMLAKQGDIEKVLFNIQREVAVTLDEVYRLEAVLEARERELLNISPRPKVGGN